MDNPLNEYLKSLDLLDKLEIETVLPCHADIKFNVRKRGEELRQHYEGRCKQITELLKPEGPMAAWQAAEHTTRTEAPKELNALSDVSKWFFFLSACMALKYMASRGMVKFIQNSERIRAYSA